jgi:hypothetical protein
MDFLIYEKMYQLKMALTKQFIEERIPALMEYLSGKQISYQEDDGRLGNTCIACYKQDNLRIYILSDGRGYVLGIRTHEDLATVNILQKWFSKLLNDAEVPPNPIELGWARTCSL